MAFEMKDNLKQTVKRSIRKVCIEIKRGVYTLKNSKTKIIYLYTKHSNTSSYTQLKYIREEDRNISRSLSQLWAHKKVENHKVSPFPKT